MSRRVGLAYRTWLGKIPAKVEPGSNTYFDTTGKVWFQYAGTYFNRY